MKIRSFPLLFLMCLTACHTSPDNRYYALSPTVSSAVKSSADTEWALGTVRVPDILDRPQIVIISGTNTVTLLEYDRWAEPFDSMTRRILNENLQTRLGITSTVSDPHVSNHNIDVTIETFNASSTGTVTLKALWTMQTGPSDMPITMRHLFEKSEPADTQHVRATVAAMSDLLGNFADAIAADNALSTQARQ